MAAKFMRRVRKRHPKLKRWLDVEPRFVVGLPATRILEVCEKIGAQLIVVGSRGRTGLARAMLGSTAEIVARLAPVPVALVKRGSPVAR